MGKIEFPLCVRSFTYNHAGYIREAMDGFTMQQTNFPFVCVIVDDASTDGEPEIIKNYVRENFDLNDKSIVRYEETDDYMMTFAQHKENKNCYFAVYYLKYNHYSIKKSKLPYYSEWTDNVKYHAICEGDDYWIDSQKLQRQVEYMECHSECSMTCSRCKWYSEKDKKIIGEQYCLKANGILNPKDVINRQGLYIPTCSIVFRKELLFDYPLYCRECVVGDYPLQIYCAMKGVVFYFNNVMSVYRRFNPNSWMGRQKWQSFDSERLNVIVSELRMLEGFANDFPQYKKTFNSKIMEFINRGVNGRRMSPQMVKDYRLFFANYINQYPLKWKLDLYIRSCSLPKVAGLYKKYIMKRYSVPTQYY